MVRQPGLGADALAMKKLAHTETSIARFFWAWYCETTKVDLEISY